MKLIYPKQNSVLWSTVCSISSKLLIKRASVYKFHYRNPKMRLDPQSQKKTYLLICVTISLNIQTDKFVYRSDLETTTLLSFPSKSLNHTAINSFSQKLSNLTIPKFIVFTRTDITLQTSVKHLRSTAMCSSVSPDCGYDKSTSILLGDMYCANIKRSGKLFNLSTEAIFKFRNARLCARCAVFISKIKQIPFPCRLAEAFTFLKTIQSRNKMLLEIVFW